MAAKDTSRPRRRSSGIARRVAAILDALDRAIPEARVELNHTNPLELLVATILSAQSTDQRVNQVTPALFQRYRGAAGYAQAQLAELETLIRSTGFYRSKARSLIACGRALVERFGGKVPDRMDDLITLPGVGRKTANVMLGGWFGKPAVVVDTHVKRVAQRLGLTKSEDPDVIEQDLQAVIPLERWTSASQRLLLHGRYMCVARRPKCEQCPIYAECDWKGKRSR